MRETIRIHRIETHPTDKIDMIELINRSIELVLNSSEARSLKDHSGDATNDQLLTEPGFEETANDTPSGNNDSSLLHIAAARIVRKIMGERGIRDKEGQPPKTLDNENLKDGKSSQKNESTQPIIKSDIYAKSDNTIITKDAKRYNDAYAYLAEYILEKVSSPDRKYLFNCSSISDLKVGKLIGKGFFKLTYNGTFQGMDVAIKVPIDRNLKRDFHTCMPRIWTFLQSNSDVPRIRLAMQEICDRIKHKFIMFIHEFITHSYLQFDGINRHLGYCISTTNLSNDTLSRGIVSVYELGKDLHFHELMALPFVDRLRICFNLAKLLCNLQFSSLGSVSYSDFFPRHFKMVNGKVTIIDMDDFVTTVEPKCGPKENISQDKIHEHRFFNGYKFNCSHGLKCVNGVCVGHNAAENIHNFTKYFFKKLLRVRSVPENIYSRHKRFFEDLFTYKLSATEIKDRFVKMLLDTVSNKIVERN